MKKTIQMFDEDEQLPNKPTVEQKLDIKPPPKTDHKDNLVPLDDLPSGYRFYPQDTMIFARPLNVSEVKLLASMNQDNSDFIISDIVRRTTKGIEFDEILRFDKFYILFWLRANTYKNAGYEMDFGCSHCSKNSNFKFDVSTFNIVYAEDKNEDGVEIVLPESTDKISLKYLRIRDEKRMRDFLVMFEKNGKTYDRDLLEIAASIGMLNGEKKSIRENYEFVERLHPGDFSFILFKIDQGTFGISNVVNAKCTHCSEVMPVEIRFREEFFLPKFKLG